MSTQTTAYALLALSSFLEQPEYPEQSAARFILAAKMNCSGHQRRGPSAETVIAPKTLNGALDMTNRGTAVAYVRLILKGTPLAGRETAVNQGISMQVEYETKNGQTLSPLAIETGDGLHRQCHFECAACSGPIDRVALTQIFPSGWEIRNMRFEQLSEKESGYEYRDIRDDRVYTYCSLNPQPVSHYRIELNAAYVGRYYLPAVYASAMYDETINA